MSCDWTRPFEPDEHTVALYHFDEGAGDEAHDACGDPGADAAVRWTGVVGQPAGLRVHGAVRAQRRQSPDRSREQRQS